MTDKKCVTWFQTFVILIGLSSSARAQFEHIIGRVPSDANALVLVNGEKIFSSPIAKSNGWEKNREKMYEAGLTFLPPRAQSGLLASHLDLQLMIPLWEMSLFQFDRDLTVADIAAYTRGKIDKIVDTAVIATQTDTYIVPFENQVLGMMMPADRQKVGRWIRDYSVSSKPELSPYLTEAYGFAKNNGTPVIMAMDLLDVVSHEDVRKALDDFDAAKGLSEEKLYQIANVVSSLRGVMLGMTLKDSMFGKIRVDFGQDASVLAPFGKAMLLRAIAKRGAMIDEMADWEPKVNGNQFTLEGTLKFSGALRLSTLFHRPVSVSSKQDEASEPQPKIPEESFVRESSRVYYKKVNDLIRDFNFDSGELKTYGSWALWMDKYATRIGQLPVLNVDEEVVQFGTNTANTLRQASSSLRGGLVAGEQAARSVDTKYNTYSYSNVYGYTYRQGLFGAGYVPYGNSGSVSVPDYQATSKERSKVRNTTTNPAIADTRSILVGLSTASGEIRKKMTQKYGVEF